MNTQNIVKYWSQFKLHGEVRVYLLTHTVLKYFDIETLETKGFH